jgi:hypothetical protein
MESIPMITRLKKFPLADGRIEITVEGLPNGEVSPYLLDSPSQRKEAKIS